MAFLFFSLLLIALFLLSKEVTRQLSRLLLKVFKSHSVAVYGLSFAFLPGVILHELSHLLIASILFVPTGEIEFIPEVRENEVKMGSVAIARTDPLRRFLIGVAPVLGGIGVILLSSRYLFTALLSWQSALLLYIIFQIGNTMFSSSKDMEGALGVGAAAVLLGIILQLLGTPLWSIFVTFLGSHEANGFFLQITMFLSAALGLDVFFILIARGLQMLKIRH